MNRPAVFATAAAVIISGSLLAVAWANKYDTPTTPAEHLDKLGYFTVYPDDSHTQINEATRTWCTLADDADTDADATDELVKAMLRLAALDDPAGEWPSTRLVTEAVTFECPDYRDHATQAVTEAERILAERAPQPAP